MARSRLTVTSNPGAFFAVSVVAGAPQWYELSRQLCLQAYGENCKLMTRIMSNTGIYYEDRQDYDTACDFFVQWYEISREVSGPAAGRGPRVRARSMDFDCGSG